MQSSGTLNPTKENWMNFLDDTLLTLRGIRAYRSYLQSSDRAPAAEVRRKQSEWLGALLHHAHANVPWYSTSFRVHGVRLGSADPFAELAKLPVLSKAEVRENHADFCVPGVAAKSMKFTTSGTTGEPLIAYTNPEQWVIEQAAIWRQWKWAGYNFRDRIAIFRSYAPKSGERPIRMDRLKNWAYFSVFEMDDASIAEYAKFLQVWKPRFLRGYPSSLLLVAQHALRHGWRLPGLKGAFAASEVVTPELREALRQAFGIELFDHYGQAEITCMFHDCERHEGMHIDWEYGFVELLPSNEPGVSRIIATNLHNTSMPLLRYDTGDLAVGGWEQCSCGRTAPVLRSIRGRKDDFVVAEDGSRMATVNLYTYFSKLTSIQRFQLSQSKPGELIVNFVLWDPENVSARYALSERIRRELEQTTGLFIRVEELVEFIQTSGGKFPAFIQRIGR
jgi:phenylacetate-CoA ligase